MTRDDVFTIYGVGPAAQRIPSNHIGLTPNAPSQGSDSRQYSTLAAWASGGDSQQSPPLGQRADRVDSDIAGNIVRVVESEPPSAIAFRVGINHLETGEGIARNAFGLKATTNCTPISGTLPNQTDRLPRAHIHPIRHRRHIS